VQRIAIQGKGEIAPVTTSTQAIADLGAQQSEIAFNLVNAALLTRIDSISYRGSYGSKIGMLVKHLLLIEAEEPGSKSIVFSAWADSLKSECDAILFYLFLH
jgi:hypothetical protein